MKNALVFALLILCGCHQNTVRKTAVCTGKVNVADFKGVNWADKRDNYVDGPLLLSGLSVDDNYAAVQKKSAAIIKGLKANLGANTVRLPVNPTTATQNYWQNYTGAIDAALSANMKVILAYWEGKAHTDGFIDDTTQFYTMWHTIVNKYGDNPQVYFEIFNEPFGYSATQWQHVCKQWLDTFYTVPHCRVLIGGTGYDQNVAAMGADSTFNDCLFSQHAYAFWLPFVKTTQQWKALAAAAINPYQNRTILTEFGVPMTSGVDYTQPANGSADIAFLQAMTRYCDSLHIGSCYWPGLRDSDGFSLQVWRNDSMITTNTSGRQLVLHGWGVKE